MVPPKQPPADAPQMASELITVAFGYRWELHGTEVLQVGLLSCPCGHILHQSDWGD